MIEGFRVRGSPSGNTTPHELREDVAYPHIKYGTQPQQGEADRNDAVAGLGSVVDKDGDRHRECPKR